MNTKGFGMTNVIFGILIMGVIAAISVTSINSYSRSQKTLKERKQIEVEINSIVKEAYDSGWYKWIFM